MKDYYRILGLEPSATEEQIRKGYRRLALQYHPDRNPGDSGAEERFKEIAEAYGVLMDPVKRTQYDQYRQTGRPSGAGPGFGYSQEEIFRDLFRNQRLHPLFADLLREFERSGFRFDPRFFEQTFFGQQGRYSGGFFYHGPLQAGRPGPGPRQPRPQPLQLPSFKDLVKGLARKLAQRLGFGDRSRCRPAKARPGELDLTYELTLEPEDGEQGGWVQIAVNRGPGQEVLKVRIPAGTPSGRQLRLKGKGVSRGGCTGDLYLTVHLRESLL